MNETARKERHYFEMFRRDFPLPEGKIEYGDKPDVILRGDRTIGVEITNFYLEPGDALESEQRQRVKRNSAVSEAQRLFQEQSSKNVEFTFGFDNDHPIDNEKTLARKIARLAKELSNELTGEISRDRYRQIPELSFLYLYTTMNEDALWRVNQVYTTPIMSGASLKSIVATKEAKSKSYRPCDAFWLLVIVDFFDRAQDQELSDCERLTSKVFEKIIVYKTVFGTSVEMQKR